MINDNEYLQKPLLEGVTYKINGNEVHVSSNHTSWAFCTRIQNDMTKKSMIELYSKVCKLAKNQNISVSRKNGYKKFILENWELYENEVKNFNTLFDKLIIAFKEVQKRGLHMGTCDDEVLNEAMSIRNEYEKVYYRTSTYSKMREIYKSLSGFLQSMTDGREEHYSRIYL